MKRIPTQYLFKGNVIVDVENVTGGYTWTDEGRVYITQECTFTVLYKNLRFGVEVHHVEDDHDMYAISVFDQSEERNRYRRENIFDNPNDSNEICYCHLDSSGGGMSDDTLSVIRDGIQYEQVENAILSYLFGNKELNIEPCIKEF